MNALAENSCEYAKIMFWVLCYVTYIVKFTNTSVQIHEKIVVEQPCSRLSSHIFYHIWHFFVLLQHIICSAVWVFSSKSHEILQYTICYQYLLLSSILCTIKPSIYLYIWRDVIDWHLPNRQKSLLLPLLFLLLLLSILYYCEHKRNKKSHWVYSNIQSRPCVSGWNSWYSRLIFSLAPHLVVLLYFLLLKDLISCLFNIVRFLLF